MPFFRSVIVFSILLGSLLFCGIGKASAASYYVDNACVAHNGNGSCNGTAPDCQCAGSDNGNGPFNSIAYMQAKAGGYSGNDNIYLKKGETFREQLTVPSSGTSGQPITFGAYGTGAKPIISGATTFDSGTTWDQTPIGGSQASADLMDESFDTATGYDLTWAEDAGAGSSIDEDATDITAHDGAQSLKMIKAATNARTVHTLAAEAPIVTAQFWWYMDSNSISSGNENNIFQGLDAATNQAFYVVFNIASSVPHISAYFYNNGATSSRYTWSGSVTTGSWYKIGIRYDATNLTYAFTVNDEDVQHGSLTGTIRTGVKTFRLGDSTHALTITTHSDTLKVSSSATLWPIVSGTNLPANTWKTALATQPTSVYFNTVNSVVRGHKETVVANVDAEYDWYYDALGYLVVYGATTPSAVYTSVEAVIRGKGITATSKDYITVSGLELAYTNTYGLQNRSGTGWLVDSNTVHHIGAPGAAWPAEGIGIEGSTGSTVTNNAVYETGRHGIDLIPASGTSSGNVIEKNVVYNCYHSGIDLANTDGTNTGNIIRRNKIYTDVNYVDFSLQMNGIYSDGDATHATDATQIYYNLIYNLPGRGIQVGNYSTNSVVYNNTVATKNASFGSWMEGILINGSGISGIIVKNNLVEGYDVACKIGDSANIAAVDYNAWYTSGGVYTQADGVSYHSDDQAAYISALTAAGVSGADAHGKWEDPLLVSTSDFHLQPTSPAINAGTDVGLSTDYASNPVPSGSGYDIGAYEYQADTTPGAFVFTDITNASLSTEYTSNPITVTGIDDAAAITITGGTYSKNSGAYTSDPGTVVVGNTVTVRVTSSASYSTAVDAVLTIGGVSDTYTVTTAQSDITPPAGPTGLSVI